ncbi:hypothetical protein QOT17_003950 [Balamuthia mandrillaris]
MTCNEALVTLNTTSKRIAFIVFHADKWGGSGDEPYKELPEVFYHKKLDAYMRKLRYSSQPLSPRLRRLKWLATHGIMQRKNKFEAILPAVVEQDRVRYVASWFRRSSMAERYGNQHVFMAVKQLLDSGKVISAIDKDNDEAMLKNVWDWMLSDTLIALCGCTFGTYNDSQTVSDNIQSQTFGTYNDSQTVSDNIQSQTFGTYHDSQTCTLETYGHCCLELMSPKRVYFFRVLKEQTVLPRWQKLSMDALRSGKFSFIIDIVRKSQTFV